MKKQTAAFLLDHVPMPQHADIQAVKLSFKVKHPEGMKVQGL